LQQYNFILLLKKTHNILSFKFLILTLLSVIAATIYFLYRDNTIIFNQILSTFNGDNLLNKRELVSTFPLPNWAIYSLPGGIWVFVLTSLLSHNHICIQKERISLDYLPITYGIVLEFVQLLEFTDGTFDFVDLVFNLGSGFIALVIHKNQQSLALNWQTSSARLILISGFLVLILSDVYK
jgi:hypothetical protein